MPTNGRMKRVTEKSSSKQVSNGFSSGSKKRAVKEETPNHLITEYFLRAKRIPSKDLEKIREKFISYYVSPKCDSIDLLSIKDFACKGKGIVAQKAISKGSFICEYAGDLLDLDKAKVSSAPPFLICIV